ncbi:hypothetical protein Tco_0756966 [Tanacetum coccineum]
MLFIMLSWKRVAKIVHQCWHRVITFSGNPESRDTLTPNLTVNSSNTNLLTSKSTIHESKAEKTVHAKGSSETTTERYMENYKNVSQDIRDQLNAEAEAVQIILTGIDNDIYSTVDACPNASMKCGKPLKVETSELLNGNSPVVSKSSAVHAADNPDKRQQHNTTHTSTTTDVADPPPLNIHSTHQTPTQVPTVTAPENIIQAETNTENAQFDDDEFINIFSTPVQEQGRQTSRPCDSSNMHTFYQHHPSAQRWTKDHPLEQVIRNSSQFRTRRQLETDGEMCMFALTVSRTEPKNIKEAMVDSAWIESMQEELHQ